MEIHGNVNYFQCEHNKIFSNEGNCYYCFLFIIIEYDFSFNNKSLITDRYPCCKCPKIENPDD